MDEDLLTIPEAAAALKVSPVTVARWLKQGRLPAYRMGPRAVRIRRDDLLVVLKPSGHATGARPDTGVEADAATTEPGGIDGVGVAGVAGALSADDRLAALREAEGLRDRILTRRKGVHVPAFDAERGGGGGGKEKRGKRS